MKSIIFTCMFVVLSLIQGFPQLDYRTGWQQDSLYGNPSKVLTSIYQLTEKFGEPVKDDMIKRMIGHMIRPIMEHNGFELDRKGVQCRKKRELFSLAARYKRG